MSSGRVFHQQTYEFQIPRGEQVMLDPNKYTCTADFPEACIIGPPLFIRISSALMSWNLNARIRKAFVLTDCQTKLGLVLNYRLGWGGLWQREPKATVRLQNRPPNVVTRFISCQEVTEKGIYLCKRQ